MTVAELDTKLENWRQVAESALNNVMEVYENPTYKSLCEGKFTGETAARLGDPCKINKLAEQASILKSFVDRAFTLRKGITLLNKGERVAEIDALLTKDSITLGDELTPLANRTLTGKASVTRRCTPKELLDRLTSEFDLAKALVSDIDAIQTSILRKLDDMRRDLQLFQVQHPTSPEVAGALQRSLELDGLVMTDPVGAQRILEDEIAPLLTAARAANANEHQARSKISAGIAKADYLMRELQAAHVAAAAAVEERKLKLITQAPLTEALSDSEIERMIEWLATLKKTAATPEWKCVVFGIDKWISKADEQIASERKAASESRAIIERRLELRGLLGALQAKVSGEGRGEEPGVVEAGRKARELLYQRPTPMEEAERLVREYQRLS